MCWAVPGKVIRVEGLKACVDLGGVEQEVITTIDVKPGDYVMVHAGIIIEKIKEKEAKELMKSFAELYVEFAVQDGVPREKAEKEIFEKMKSLFD